MKISPVSPRINVRVVSLSQIDEICDFIVSKGLEAKLYTTTKPLSLQTSSEMFVFAENWSMKVEDLEHFFHEYGYLSKKYSTPSAFGYSILTSRYVQDIGLRSKKSDYRYIALKNALYGGRCEAFRVGSFDAVYADINSSYPYALSKLKTHFRYFASTNTASELWRAKHGVAYARIRQKETFYPVLPFRSEHIYYPYGEWYGYYTLDELRYAREKMVDVRIIKGYYSIDDEVADFEGFVSFLYGMKSEHKAFKLILNSTIGRIAASGKFFVYFPRKTDKSTLKIKIGNSLWYGIEVEIDYGVNPYIAAYCLSDARVRLHELIERNNAYYCDTDAIISTVSNYDVGPEIGKLKIEFGNYEIFGPKRYIKNGEIKLAGIPKKAQSRKKLLELRYGNNRKREGDITFPYHIKEIKVTD